MAGYDYTNPGVAASDALELFMAERALKKRQAMLDQIAAQREERLAEQHKAEMEMRKLEHDDRMEQFKASREDKEGAAVDKELESLLPGDIPDASLVDRATRTGRGSRLTPARPAMGPDFAGPMDTGETPQEAQIGSPIRFRGTPEQRTAMSQQQALQKFAEALQGGIDPKKAVASYLQEGGDPQRVAPLINALETDPVQPSDPDVREVGGYIYRRGPDGKWVEEKSSRDPARAASGGGAGARASGLDPTLPPEYANALDRAILMVPSTRRPVVVNMANRLWDAKDTDQLKQVIRQAAIEGENVAMKTQITGRANAAAALRDIRVGLQELKAAGINTNLATGTIENFARMLGKTSDPKIVALGTRIMDAYVEYRRSLTGVQFSEREAADYAKLFPTFYNELPVNEAILDGLERGMATRDRQFWESKVGADGARLIGVVGDPVSAAPAPAASATPAKPNVTITSIRKVPAK